MRFPWVGRARMESEVLRMEHLYANATERTELWRASHDAAVSQVASLGAELVRSGDRYDALLEKYHALKVQGATLEVAPLALETREYDPIADAITRKAGANLHLRGLMGRRAAQEKAAGVPIMKIVENIETGQTDNEGPAY